MSRVSDPPRLLPGDAAVLAARLEAELNAAGRRGLDEDGALQRLADGPGNADARRWALERLVAEGRAIEYRGRYFAPRFTEWQVGTVQALARGDALLLSGDGGEPGHFVRARNLNGALDGDLVLARPLRRERGGRGRRLPEATVSRILTARAKTLVGRLEPDRGGSRLVLTRP
jgi:exoribonuclease R